MKEDLGIDLIDKITDKSSEMHQFTAAATDASKEFDTATKIGIYKELHKKGLLNDYELMALVAKQAKYGLI